MCILNIKLVWLKLNLLVFSVSAVMVYFYLLLNIIINSTITAKFHISLMLSIFIKLWSNKIKKK